MSIDSVLVLEPTPFTDAVCEELGPGLTIARGPLSRADLLETIGGFDAALVRLGHQIDSEVLARANRLRVIATPTTGLTHIDLALARTRGIDVLSLRDETALLETLPATAELTWALVLAVTRKLSVAARHTAGGGWNRDLFWASELAGKSIGILGYGRIGRIVARYALAFGMKVFAYDRHPDSGGDREVAFVGKDELLRAADVVTLHLHYEQGAPPFLTARDFDIFKKGSILINTARGELLDEAALESAIRAGSLAGAGLDVLSGEPSVNARIVGLQETHNVIVTPHIGGATIESIEKTELFIARKLRMYVEARRT